MCDKSHSTANLRLISGILVDTLHLATMSTPNSPMQGPASNNGSEFPSPRPVLSTFPLPPWAGFPSPDVNADSSVSMETYSPSLRSNAVLSEQQDQDQANAQQDWAILLIDAERTEYLFVKNLSEGTQSVVQLCQELGDAHNKQFVVRKRSREHISTTRALRPDRECRIAQAIYRKRDQLLRDRSRQRQSEQQPRFTELLSFSNLPADSDSDNTNQGKFFRESFWRYCDGVGNLKDLLMFLAKKKQLPAALILHFIHEVLRAVQWLNTEDSNNNSSNDDDDEGDDCGAAIFHCDLHCRNILLEWDAAGMLQPVLGDFGYARLEPPHEPTWNERTLFVRGLNGGGGDDDDHDDESFMANLSSPPADYVAFQDPQDRMPLDFAHFAETLYRLLQVLIGTDMDFDRDDDDDDDDAASISSQQEQYDAVLSLLERLLEKGREDRQGCSIAPPEQRPPRPDISEEIAHAAALLDEYAYGDDNEQVKLALAAWSQSVPSVNPSAKDGRSLRPLSFATEEAARLMADKQRLGENGPYAVVNIRDEQSVKAGVRLLVAMRQDGGDPQETSSDAHHEPAWGLQSLPTSVSKGVPLFPSSSSSSVPSADNSDGQSPILTGLVIGRRPSSPARSNNDGEAGDSRQQQPQHSSPPRPIRNLSIHDDSSESFHRCSPASDGQNIARAPFFRTPPRLSSPNTSFTPMTSSPIVPHAEGQQDSDSAPLCQPSVSVGDGDGGDNNNSNKTTSSSKEGHGMSDATYLVPAAPTQPSSSNPAIFLRSQPTVPVPSPTASFTVRTRGQDAARAFMAGNPAAVSQVLQARDEAARSLLLSPPRSNFPPLPSSSSSSSPSSFLSSVYVQQLNGGLQARKDDGKQQKGNNEDVFHDKEKQKEEKEEVQIQQLKERIHKAEEERRGGWARSIRCKFV
ncbi:hypothetical protein BD289DRAFT_127797 [Coniella lustricola]|uniref:Protein kinase domain-containing protein n=1 Tax=Coniella lustricola TaxID=2025994 RepID=A0A2T2ZW58_9PEZI|nr:hypothetical protein BD289DRAFT_127797 [Coniella lustricola]